MQYLVVETTHYTPTINLFAEVFKPAKHPEFEGDGDWKQLEVRVIKGENEFLASQIKNLIEIYLGNGWGLTHFWIPETSEEAPF